MTQREFTKLIVGMVRATNGWGLGSIDGKRIMDCEEFTSFVCDVFDIAAECLDDRLWNEQDPAKYADILWATCARVR